MLSPVRSRQALLGFLVSVMLPCGAAKAVADAVDTRAEPTRPRIGLVLGGGGARGAAHIGVLKVLEELRIPVDYVAGTSMGSIVGGLFASGMSPAEIEAEIVAMDWVGLFEDYPERQDRSFRRKRDDDTYAFKAKVGFNDGKIELPYAVVRGQKMDLALKRLTLPVVEVTDFDDLPIPYRAVAADIETGREVVLGKGNLARSIRASLAVPAAFDPVIIDDRLLVDGGIANNVPVSVARDMGAEVFIVVDVGSGLMSRDEIDSGLAISGQLMNFLFSLNSEAQLKTLGPNDTLIVPDLGDIDGGDFERTAEAIAPGEVAARAAIESLKRYSVSEDEFAAYVANRAKRQPDEPVIDQVVVDNNSGIGDEVIAAHISARAGEPLDVTQLELDISTIYGLELFESVRYDLNENYGDTELIIEAKAKHWGPGFLQTGLTSSNNFEGDSTLRFGLLYTRTQINALNGEWRVGGQVGDENGIFTELYQPLDPALRYFVAGLVGNVDDIVNTYDDAGNNLSRYQVDYTGFELATGREFATWGEGRIGFRRYTGSAELKIGQPVPDVDVDLGEFYLRLSADKLDNLYFPTSGYLSKLEYIAARDNLGATRDYDQIELGYNHAFSWGDHTLVSGLNFGTTLDDNAPLEGLYELGGLMRLSGLQEDQLAGQHAGLLAFNYMQNLKRAEFLKSWFGASLEYGNVWQDAADISFSDAILAGSIYLAVETPFGPIFLGYGRTDTDESSLYLHIGPRLTFK